MLKYINILQKHPHPWRFLFAKILVSTQFCRLFTIPRSGYRLRFFPSNLALQFWIDPDARSADLLFYRAFLRPGDTVVDVGANIGDTVLTIAMTVGATGKVWAIEPHPRVFRYLLGNCQLNGVRQVICVNVAIGNATGTLVFSDSKRDDMNQLGTGPLRVPIKTLDEVICEAHSIALLKIDVEGYEKFVLEGAERILRRIDCIYCEASVDHYARFGYRVKDLIALLHLAGFAIYRRVSSATLIEVDERYVPIGVEDLIAVRDRKLLFGRTGWSAVN